MRKSLWLGLGLLFVAGIVLVLHYPASNPGKQPSSWRLPDGSLLSFEKATFGTNHVFRSGRQWQVMLEPLVPPFLKRKLGVTIVNFASPDGVALWFRRSQVPTRAAVPELQLAILDENEFETRCSGALHTVWFAPSGLSLTYLLSDYPRGSRRVGVRVYCRANPNDPLTLLGQFSVPNRARRSPRRWKPDLLPASRQTNNIEITLVELQTGLRLNSASIPSSDAAMDWSRARFQIQSLGDPSTDWEIREAWAISPSGSHRVGSKMSSSEDLEDIVFPGTLWLDEPAWKVVAAVSRRANFPPEQVWRIEQVAVPFRGQVVETYLVTNMLHAELVFLGVSAPGAGLPTRYVGEKGRWNLHLRTPYPVPELKLKLLAVQDERGRLGLPLETVSVPSDGGRGVTLKETLYGFAFELPRGAQTIDAAFAVTPVAFVEFFAKPTIAR